MLKVSESCYYRWLKNRGKPTARELLSVEIQAILEEHPDNDNYGVRRINMALEQKGIRVSLRTVYRTMSEMGILHRRSTRRGTTKATTEIQDRENLIKRDFKAEKPLRKLLSDITEIQCCDGRLYVSVVLDCYNGEILSAAMDSNMKKEKIYRIPAYRLTRDQVKSIVFRYIFVYYNRIRISSVNLGGFLRLLTANGRGLKRRRSPDAAVPHLNLRSGA